MSRVLVILTVSIFFLASCGLSPNQQYTLAVVAYDGAALGLGVKNAQKPFSATTWQNIQEDEATARQRLASTKKWLVENPMLARTPNAPFPPLDPLNLAIEAVVTRWHDVSGVELISPTPPSTPTTQPG